MCDYFITFWSSSVSQSVTTESLSLYDKESGRALGVLMKLGKKDDFNPNPSPNNTAAVLIAVLVVVLAYLYVHTFAR